MYEKWEKMLNNTDLFQGIKIEELDILLKCLRPRIRSYKKNESIANFGDSFKGLGVILEGSVMVIKENLAGNRFIMAKFEKGNIFGEMLAFSDQKIWQVSVQATEDATVLFMESEKITGTCERDCPWHTMLIQNMLKMLSKRALMLNRKLEYLSIKGMREKISTYILEQHKLEGKMTFMIPLNRNELADFLNVSRPSMSREMARMKDEDIIDYYKSTIKILNLEALKKAIN